MNQVFRSFYFWAMILFICVAAYISLILWEWENLNSFNVAELSAIKEVSGTPATLEREFKLRVKDYSHEKLPTLKRRLAESLHEINLQQQWQATKIIRKNYRLQIENEPQLFLDFYFDSEEFLFDQFNMVYRLRYRWRSVAAFHRYINGGRNSEDFPSRCEIQCKFDRRDLGQGLSQVMESRFEFRNESQPFNELFPAPQAPWPFLEYFNIASGGKFLEETMSPSVDCARAILVQSGQRKLKVTPYLAAVLIRHRAHFKMQTPWGSAKEPDDAFVVTLDESWASSDIGPLLKQVQVGDYNTYFFKKHYKPLGAEIEIEFERNIADQLDKKTNLPAQTAFLQDHLKLKDSLILSLGNKGIELEPIEKSKIKQFREATYNEDRKGQ